MRVAVIDGDEGVREEFRVALAPHGEYDVRTFETPEVAIEHIRRIPYDVLIVGEVGLFLTLAPNACFDELILVLGNDRDLRRLLPDLHTRISILADARHTLGAYRWYRGTHP